MKIFVISLAESNERRKSIAKNLTGMNYEFFDAENVKNNPEHFIFSLYNRKKTQQLKGYELTNAELGCSASHISLWRQCVEKNEVFLIIEDNVEIYGNLKKQLSNIDKLTKKYGLVKLGNIFQHKFKKVQKIDETYQLITQLRGGCGTSAYAISPEAAKNYLSKINNFFEPIDDFIDCEWRTKQTVYSYNPQLASRSKIQSTIGNRKIKKSHSVKNKIKAEIYRFHKKIDQKIYNILHK